MTAESNFARTEKLFLLRLFSDGIPVRVRREEIMSVSSTAQRNRDYREALSCSLNCTSRCATRNDLGSALMQTLTPALKYYSSATLTQT